MRESAEELKKPNLWALEIVKNQGTDPKERPFILFTQCRGCGEKFILEVAQLIHSRGQVRCNMCGTVFDALETLSAEKPLEDEDFLIHDFDNAPPLLTQVFDIDIEPDDDVLQVLNDLLPENLPQPQSGSGAAKIEWEMAKALAEQVILDESSPAIESHDNGRIQNDGISIKSQDDAPMFTEKKVKKEKASSGAGFWGFWGLLSAAMLVLVCWQLVLVLEQGKLQLPATPWAEKICTWVECAKTKKEVDISAISLVSRNIRPHPGRDQALMISASMINGNENSAKFPVLEIKLSNLSGQVVGMRRFLPEEYVSDEIIASGFIKNTLVPFSLEVVSPGDDAVAFEIGFVQP